MQHDIIWFIFIWLIWSYHVVIWLLSKHTTSHTHTHMSYHIPYNIVLCSIKFFDWLPGANQPAQEFFGDPEGHAYLIDLSRALATVCTLGSRKVPLWDPFLLLQSTCMFCILCMKLSEYDIGIRYTVYLIPIGNTVWYGMAAWYVAKR